VDVSVMEIQFKKHIFPCVGDQRKMHLCNNCKNYHLWKTISVESAIGYKVFSNYTTDNHCIYYIERTKYTEKDYE
jgi:hypothetical protein